MLHVLRYIKKKLHSEAKTDDKMLTKLTFHQPWASADFFPGEGKIFQGGQKHAICLKNAQKYTIFFQKS
jgi:hypothetical protein